MAISGEDRAARALAAHEEEILLYVNDPSPAVIKNLLENRRLTEEHILIIAGRKNLPSEILESIFRDKRWTDSYRVRLALAKNPKTPLFSALSIARFLRLFDLAELARNHYLSALYRKKLEAVVMEKIPTLALGIKKTLAKTAGGEILLALIQDGYPEVVRQCLENPSLAESSLYKVIGRTTTPPGTIRTIAEHRAWTSRYHVKFALVRNEHTPLARSVLFLPGLRTADLKDLYRDPHLPPGVRPSIHRELLGRGVEPVLLLSDDSDEVIYEIEESELQEMERETPLPEIRRDGGSSGDAERIDPDTDETGNA